MISVDIFRTWALLLRILELDTTDGQAYHLSGVVVPDVGDVFQTTVLVLDIHRDGHFRTVDRQNAILEILDKFIRRTLCEVSVVSGLIIVIHIPFCLHTKVTKIIAFTRILAQPGQPRIR
jgi:hypothetical protein